MGYGLRVPAARAGRDLKLLEVVVDVDRHHMVGVLRILPVRQGVREDGRLDVSAATRLAMKRVDLRLPAEFALGELTPPPSAGAGNPPALPPASSR